MTIPTIPTDNYYKFFALSGVVVTITCIILYLNQWNVINDEIDKTSIEITQLELEKKFLEEDSVTIDFQISRLGSFDTTLAKLNLDSVITEHFKVNSTALQNDKNLRDYYEFLFKYVDKIIPLVPKVEKIKEAHLQQVQVRRNLTLKIALIKDKIGIQNSKNNKLLISGIVLGIFFVIGLRISSRGFVQWYNLVQKPSDEKLALEVQELKKEQSL